MKKLPDTYKVLPGGHLFGELAVSMQLVEKGQVQEGLARQDEMKQEGLERRLGEILVQVRVLNLRSVQKVLLEQQKQRKTSEDAGGKPSQKRLGDYELLSKLGEGGMGSVYKARDTKMDRIVALKVLSRKLSGDSRFVERFRREIKLTAAVNHPNIVTAFGAGEADGLPYLAMEYVEGESLYQKLKRSGKLSEKEAMTIIRSLAAGLGHAHDHGMIHRDVKPDNALIGRHGEIKMADLGLAKSIDDDQRLTKTGTAIGTPHYISPEQARGEKDVDHRSDIYSLGASLYTLMTGQRPFDGKNNAEIMLKHLNEELENPQDLVPEISDGAVAIICRMMAKEPRHRYDSCEELIADIDKLLGGGNRNDGALTVGVARGASSIKAPQRKRRRKTLRAKTAGGGCLVMMTLGGGLLAGGLFVCRSIFWS